MNIMSRRRIDALVLTVLTLILAFGMTACGDKTAEETTATATSQGKSGANSAPQQPGEQGKAANGGAGKQLPAPLNAPPP
jgi:hypothetical protein